MSLQQHINLSAEIPEEKKKKLRFLIIWLCLFKKVLINRPCTRRGGFQLKKQTLKTVNLDIERITAQIEKKKASLLSLQQEIKGLEAQLKECNEIRNQLTREGVQQQVNTWFRDKSIQPEQLGKIVSVITQLKDKINDLDESDIVEAVRMIADDRKNNTKNETVVNSNAGTGTAEHT